MKVVLIALGSLLVASLSDAAEPQTSPSSADASSTDVSPALTHQSCDAYYPQTVAAGTVGRTGIGFLVMDSGGIQNPAVTQKSGNDNLDAAALNCVNNLGINFNVRDQHAISGGGVASGFASVDWTPSGHSTVFVGCPYPIVSIRLNQQGEIEVAFRISADGKVSNPVISKSSGYAPLDAMALSCAVNLHYTPSMHNGTPVETSGSTKYSYGLKG